mgnify:CR=1 FL=1
MSDPKPSFNQQVDHIKTSEKFTRIIEAILGGQYSWACVLMLEMVGYNPQDYIPDRTYTRLIKKNKCTLSQETNQSKTKSRPSLTSQVVKEPKATTQITELDYLKPSKKNTVRGGKMMIQYDF